MSSNRSPSRAREFSQAFSFNYFGFNCKQLTVNIINIYVQCSKVKRNGLDGMVKLRNYEQRSM